MRYLGKVLKSKPENNAEEVIITLSDRLRNSSLSTDRQSAVLGLKSFSKDLRESVISHGTRALIHTLCKDYQNIKIVKPILKVFLTLLFRNETCGREVFEEINEFNFLRQCINDHGKEQESKFFDEYSLWISDELTYTADFMSKIIKILQEINDFYIQYYTMILLEVLLVTRPEKTKVCLINISDFISTILELISGSHELIRNEAILIMQTMCKNNINVQNLAVFEGIFEVAFNIIKDEGSMNGLVVVQDCLGLLYNVLICNSSNQKNFLDLNFFSKLLEFLCEPFQKNEPVFNDSLENCDFVWTLQKTKNITSVLDICKLFITEDLELFLYQKKNLSGLNVFKIISKLLFSQKTPIEIKRSSLITLGYLICSNPRIQLQFFTESVNYIDPTSTLLAPVQERNFPFVQALLNLVLLISSIHFFDLRFNALICLSMCFKDNKEVKRLFINDQIELFMSEKKNVLTSVSSDLKKTNIFSILMNFSFEQELDPYKIWFSSSILIYIFDDFQEIKDTVLNLSIGDLNLGEEVMSSIQAMSNMLITTFENPDPQASIGYLMLLTVWLYDDFKSVDCFLSDHSIIDSLLTYLKTDSSDLKILLHGMINILLGIVYEFSSNNSPITRINLHKKLKKHIGNANYLFKIRQFKNNVLFKYFTQELDYENKTNCVDDFPSVYFNEIYVNLLKQNFSRIEKALFRDPHESSYGHISYETFEKLKIEHNNLEKHHKSEIERFENENSILSKKVESLSLENSQNIEKLLLLEQNCSTVTTKNKLLNDELIAIKKINKELQEYNQDLLKENQNHLRTLKDLKSKLAFSLSSVTELNNTLSVLKSQKVKLEDGVNSMTREMFQFKKQKKNDDQKLKLLESDLSSTKNEFETYKTKSKNILNELKTNFVSLEVKNKDLIQSLDSLKASETIHANTIVDLDKDLSLLKSSNKILEHRVQELEPKLNSYTNQIKDLENDIDKKNTEIEKIDDIKLELLSITEKKYEIISDFENFKKQKELEINDLKSQISDLTIAQKST